MTESIAKVVSPFQRTCLPLALPEQVLPCDRCLYNNQTVQESLGFQRQGSQQSFLIQPEQSLKGKEKHQLNKSIWHDIVLRPSTTWFLSATTNTLPSSTYMHYSDV